MLNPISWWEHILHSGTATSHMAQEALIRFLSMELIPFSGYFGIPSIILDSIRPLPGFHCTKT